MANETINATVTAVTEIVNKSSYHMCNPMTGQGWDTAFGGPYTLFWLGVAIAAFIVLLVRKWGAEEVGLPFGLVSAFIGLIAAEFIMGSLTCSHKWSFLAGLIGAMAAGYGMGYAGIDQTGSSG